MNPFTELKELAEKRATAILAQREEVLEAFVAKYGLEPDRFVQVLQGNEWSVRRKTDEETQPAMNHDNAPDPIKLGDYVLASHYQDADAYDPWRVGFVVKIIDTWNRGRTYIIGEQDGTFRDHREYRHAKPITAEQGKAWLDQHKTHP